MKNPIRYIILLTATLLTSVGLTAQADVLSKKVVADMDSPSQGTIAQSIWCGNGDGPPR